MSEDEFEALAKALRGQMERTDQALRALDVAAKSYAAATADALATRRLAVACAAHLAFATRDPMGVADELRKTALDEIKGRTPMTDDVRVSLERMLADLEVTVTNLMKADRE